jgi:hypothetical protein
MGVVEIFSVDPTVQGPNDSARYVGLVNNPGIVLPTSDQSITGNDTEWKRQIGIGPYGGVLLGCKALIHHIHTHMLSNNY